MKNLLKWAVRIIVGFVLLVIIAAFVLPMVIDPNDYKDSIEDKIYTTLNREAHLNGEIQWKVFPWLALTFNDVELENEKGFKGDTLAKINKLSAQVKILPLLSKNIEIGRVELEDAQFNLQITKKGNSNWQGILDHLNQEQPENKSTDQPSSGSINIAGVDLNNIKINYTDLQSKTKAVITQFNLTTGEISKDSAVELDASFHMSMPDDGLNVDVSTELLANNLLADNKDILVSINDFEINGKLNSQSQMPLEISITKPGVLDLGKDTLTVPALLIKLDDAKITTNVSGSNITKTNSKLVGNYQVDAFNLNIFLKKLTGAYFVTNDTFDEFGSSGKWQMGTNSLKLSQLKINFADTAITGDATIKNLEKMSGGFNLNINTLDIDAFLGNDETAQSSASETTQSPDINFGHLKGQVTIDKLLASGTSVDNLKITVNTSGSKMVMSPIKADFYQGLLITAIKVDTKASKNKVIVEHKMNKIHAGPLLTDLAGSKLLTGIGDLDVDLNIDKPFSDIPLKTAHGKINYTLKDGAIYGVDVFGMMQKGLSLLYPEVKEETSSDEKKTSFALMQIDADINQGILTTNTLKIESPYLIIGGKLKIDLVNMTIDGTIEPMLLDIPEQLVSDKYRKLLNLPIPVSLSGSLLEPTIKIDAKKLILSTQKQRIDKEKEKLKGKLLDSLFGKKKDD